MRGIKEQFESRGAVHKGLWPTEGYEFNDSDSVEGDYFFGLALDLDQQKEMTDERIEQWVGQIIKEFGI
jgi:flavodoxin I